MIDYYYDLLSGVAEVHVMDPIYFGSISFILHFKLFSSLMCCYLDRHREPHTLTFLYFNFLCYCVFICLTCGMLSLVSIVIRAKPIHKPTLGLLIQDFIGCCRMINQTSSCDMQLQGLHQDMIQTRWNTYRIVNVEPFWSLGFNKFPINK